MCMKRPENEEPQRKYMHDEAGTACHKEQHPGIDPEKDRCSMQRNFMTSAE